MMICRLCKHPSLSGSNYCENCNVSVKAGAVRKKHGGKSTRGSKKSKFFNIVGVCIIAIVSFGSYTYSYKNASTYNKAVELWNDGEIKAAVEVAKDVSENSRQYKDAQKLIEISEDYFLYSKALELWNDGEIKEAIDVAKEVSESSNQYKYAQELIQDGEDYLLYSKAVYLWNVSDYEKAIEIFSSFTEESEYYMQAQNVLNEM